MNKKTTKKSTAKKDVARIKISKVEKVTPEIPEIIEKVQPELKKAFTAIPVTATEIPIETKKYDTIEEILTISDMQQIKNNIIQNTTIDINTKIANILKQFDISKQELLDTLIIISNLSRNAPLEIEKLYKNKKVYKNLYKIFGKIYED